MWRRICLKYIKEKQISIIGKALVTAVAGIGLSIAAVLGSWTMLAEREMTNVELRLKVGIALVTFMKLRHNQEVTLPALMKITDILDCVAGDTMSFVKGNDENKK